MGARYTIGIKIKYSESNISDFKVLLATIL